MLYIAGLSLITVIAVLLSPETNKTDISAVRREERPLLEGGAAS